MSANEPREEVRICKMCRHAVFFMEGECWRPTDPPRPVNLVTGETIYPKCSHERASLDSTSGERCSHLGIYFEARTK
jgi:hypothetical protein